MESASLLSSRGYVTIVKSRVVLVGKKRNDKGQPVADWAITPFNDISAIAVTKNAVVVAGTSRRGKKHQSGLHAYNLVDGKSMWKKPLPAQPVSWGIAIDQQQRVVVSLQNGSVLAFGK